jgi:uncharacterized FlaG/YvyC family protein
MRFQYTAVNKQGKNLSGVINADSEEKARAKLKTLKLSIVAIEQVAENNDQLENKFKYKFEAKNKEEKKVIGTVEAINLIGAFQKLIHEYELTVIKLASITATEIEFETSRTQVEKLYNEDSKLNTVKKQDKSEQEYYKNKQREEFTKTIEEIIKILRTILTDLENDLTKESKDFIVKYTDHLEKIKYSENIESVIASANKVLKYLQSQQIYIDQENNSELKLNLRLDFMQKYGLLKKIGRNFSGQQSTVSKALGALGVESQENNKMLQTLKNLSNELRLVFTVKNKGARKAAFYSFIKNIKLLFAKRTRIQSSVTKSHPKNPNKISKIETELHNITFWVTAIYLSYFFIASFVSQKIFLGELSPIWYPFYTSFLIYFIIAIMFIHISIHLRVKLVEQKISYSKSVYFLFGVLYLLILINL